ncbi:MAG: hypothetical protein ABEI53_02675, partial [Candidatus Magasanikbacteria bacterium]
EGRILSSSFTDLFSGVGWINSEKTTMHHDKVMTAFTFKPVFEWSRISNPKVDEKAFDNNSKEKVELPEKLQDKSIVDTQSYNLGSKTILATVSKGSQQYNVRAYYKKENGFRRLKEVNSNLFKDVSDPLFSSKYKGRVSIGGVGDNFLIIYGAKKGRAVQIKPGEMAQDISWGFDYRVMENGFEPGIVKARAGGENVWYIYSKTKGTPKLVKFFTNGKQKIVGGVDLSNEIFSRRTEKAEFHWNKEKGVLIAKILKNSKTSFWKFTDKGFSNSSKKRVVSSDINNYPADLISASIKIPNKNFIPSADFYMQSGNGYQKVKPGTDIKFSKGNKKLLWKAEFQSMKNKFHSPFFGEIRLRYKVEF